MGIHGIEYGHEHERLEHLLRSVDRPGDYCVGGRLYTPMPRVVVDGAGELSFPIPDAQIGALIAAAERAPYGKGTETLVHTSVRDCWQIDATHVRLAGRAWPDSFARLMDLVAAGLLDHEYSEGGRDSPRRTLTSGWTCWCLAGSGTADHTPGGGCSTSPCVM